MCIKNGQFLKVQDLNKRFENIGIKIDILKVDRPKQTKVETTNTKIIF